MLDCSKLLWFSDVFRLQKTKTAKMRHSQFSRRNLSNLECRVAEAHDEMLNIQRVLLANPSQALAMEEKYFQKKRIILAAAKDSFLRQ